jgi:hypothetical protein
MTRSVRPARDLQAIFLPRRPNLYNRLAANDLEVTPTRRDALLIFGGALAAVVVGTIVGLCQNGGVW